MAHYILTPSIFSSEIYAHFVSIPDQNSSRFIRRDQTISKMEFIDIQEVTSQFYESQGVAEKWPGGIRGSSPCTAITDSMRRQAV